jgi:hypothetical protein
MRVTRNAVAWPGFASVPRAWKPLHQRIIGSSDESDAPELGRKAAITVSLRLELAKHRHRRL